MLAGSGAFALSTSQQAIAMVNGAPAAGVAAPILAANANIAALFSPNPTYFGIGEEGGQYTGGGSGGQTITDTVNLTVDLTQLSARHDLKLGLFDGTAIGSGVSGLTFEVLGDGVTLVNRAFNGAAATSDAITFFTNNALDLGSLASGPLSGGTLTLTIVMTVTTAGSGQGFYGGFLIGDPPATRGPASPSRFAAAIASLGGAAGHIGVQTTASPRALQPPLLAGPGLHAA